MENTRKSNRPAIAFAFAALIAAVPSPTLARGETVTEQVPYGDLNLASPAGVQALDRRLDRAVERVCGKATPRGNIRESQLIRDCMEQARQSIHGQREFAIANATGNRPGWAESSPRGTVRVSLAE